MRDSLGGRFEGKGIARSIDADSLESPENLVDPLPGECLSHWGLKRGLEFIHRHYTEKLRLADAASEACLTRCYFSSLFREAMGITFHDYVVRL
ncbi:MAG: helix-turn-helix transcriptional regulator [Gemmatimonadales bacterium]|jgi:AraC-like DNA-binding protein